MVIGRSSYEFSFDEGHTAAEDAIIQAVRSASARPDRAVRMAQRAGLPAGDYLVTDAHESYGRYSCTLYGPCNA